MSDNSGESSSSAPAGGDDSDSSTNNEGTDAATSEVEETKPSPTEPGVQQDDQHSTQGEVEPTLPETMEETTAKTLPEVVETTRETTIELKEDASLPPPIPEPVLSDRGPIVKESPTSEENDLLLLMQRKVSDLEQELLRLSEDDPMLDTLHRRCGLLKRVGRGLESRCMTLEDRVGRSQAKEAEQAGWATVLQGQEKILEGKETILRGRDQDLSEREDALLAATQRLAQREKDMKQAESTTQQSTRVVASAARDTEQRLRQREDMLTTREKSLDNQLQQAAVQAQRLKDWEQNLLLKERETTRRVEEMEGQVSQREKEVAVREGRMDARELRMEQREMRAEQRETVATEREMDRNREVLDREAETRVRQQDLLRRESLVEDREANLRKHTLEIQLNEEEIRQQHSLQEERSQQIRNAEELHQTEVKKFNKRVLTKEQELAMRESTCTQRENHVARRETEMNALEKELDLELADEDERALQVIAGEEGTSVTSQLALLRKSQQESTKLRGKIRQRYGARKRDREAHNYAALCQLEQGVRTKAATFKMAIGKLCMFDVDPDTASNGDDDDDSDAAPHAAFSQAELQYLFRAIRRERDFSQEEVLLQRIQTCPWSTRHKWSTDAEILARMDVWWRSFAAALDLRRAAILKDRQSYLTHSLTILQTKRASLPLVTSVASSAVSGDDMWPLPPAVGAPNDTMEEILSPPLSPVAMSADRLPPAGQSLLP